MIPLEKLRKGQYYLAEQSIVARDNIQKMHIKLHITKVNRQRRLCQIVYTNIETKEDETFCMCGACQKHQRILRKLTKEEIMLELL